MKEKKEKIRYDEIDSIRGIAAVIILFHHYTKYIYSATGQENTWSLIIEQGKFTVEFFFVISGLLIFMTLENARKTKDFLVSRFSRLYPAYWTSMALTTLVLFLSPYNADLKISASEFFANMTMWQHWMMVKDIDGVYWTLAVEMCFYVLIYLVFAAKKNHRIMEIGLAWTTLMLVVHAIHQQGWLLSWKLHYWIPLLKNGTLFFGGIIILKLRRDPEQPLLHYYLWLTWAVHFIINGWQVAIAIAAIYGVFYLFIHDKLKFLRHPIPVFFGTICFPFYLLHQFIGYEIINFLEANAIDNFLVKLLIPFVMIVCMASLVTFLVERPAMARIRKVFGYH